MKTIIENTKGTVRFAFKNSVKILEVSKKQESLIFLHFTFGGNRFKYSTRYKSCYNNWDFQKQRIRTGKSDIFNSEYVNEYLSKLEINLNKEFSRLVDEQIEITPDCLKAFLDRFTNKGALIEKKVKKTFFDYAYDFIKVRGNEVSIITKRSYTQTIEKLKEFEKVSMVKLDFDSFDKTFYKYFTKFMNNKNYALNTTGKHIKNLKVFFNNSFDDGYSTNLKFKNKDFKSKTEETKAIYLNDDEIYQMHYLDLSKYKELELARDIFLMGYYIGQRVSDYNALKAENIIKINRTEYF